MNIIRHLSVDEADTALLIGAIATIIEQHIDDEDARPFTDRLHEMETRLYDLRVSIRKEANND